MNGLEGANCADLPGFVIDKYFYCDVGREPLRAMVALAICDTCPVTTACREQALTQSGLQQTGVIGGVSVHQIRLARRWRGYELGLSRTPPAERRPAWLQVSAAARRVGRTSLTAASEAADEEAEQ